MIESHTSTTSQQWAFITESSASSFFLRGLHYITLKFTKGYECKIMIMMMTLFSPDIFLKDMRGWFGLVLEFVKSVAELEKYSRFDRRPTTIVSTLVFGGEQVLGNDGSLRADMRPLGCVFPSRWSGRWFQSGVHHQISISSNAISTKGRCLEVDGEKYLVYQPHDSCYRCLVFSEKHDNVLQYKETYCKSERHSLRHMCSLISGDANLFAMFRLDAAPIDCPLSGPFTFSYDRGNGECGNPESTLDSCTHASRLLFNYQACPNVPKTESVEEELQCLAAWKEGSYRYFVGLIQYRHHASSYEDRFRCFAYEAISSSANVGNIRRGASPNSHHHNSHNHHKLGQTLALGSRPRSYQGIGSSGGAMNNFNESRPQSLTSSAEIVYRVEQSGDATCNGLSTMEGSRTMLLRRAQPSTAENCLFPAWVQTHTAWYNLDQSSIYEFDGNQFRVTNYSMQLINANGPDSLAMSGSCMKLLEDEPGHRATVVLHARAGWSVPRKYTHKKFQLKLWDCFSLEINYQFKNLSRIPIEFQFFLFYSVKLDINVWCYISEMRTYWKFSLLIVIHGTFPGEWSRKHEEACSYFFDPDVQPYLTLVSSTPKRAQCPAIGEFSLQIPAQEQSSRVSGFHDEKCSTNGTLRIGCSSLDSLQLEISSVCHDRNENSEGVNRSPSSREVTEYNCHGWWEEDGITYVVTTLYSTSTKLRPKRHCFVLRDSSLSESPQWMRLKTESQEGQMSLFRHSNAAGQRPQEESFHHGNTRQMLENPTTASSTSAALFFFNNNNNNNHAAGKILEIASFADSCRRNVALGRRGDLAFNATKIGHCFASSSSPPVMMRLGSVKGDGRVSMIMVMRGMVASMSQFGIQTFCWILPAMLLILTR
ncbi:hypothetical protein Ocin01_13054 [Orchesella cincta]|uniref:Uncharacterized protein n=1 Tax=Orchesella cincta TaxID=48709 RepID=A0A1D2MKR6_ORCCI|nr:hypothetical protein Ocin01_13054 [Orchesella cincta]